MAVTTAGAAKDALNKDDPFIGSWFAVEIDHAEFKAEGIFQSASGLAIDVEVVELNDASKDTISRKRPGSTKYNEVSLKRTLTADKSFWNWIKMIRDGKQDYRANGAIVIYDMSATEIGRWTLTNVWPSKWSASDLDVGSDDAMVEEVTLQVEGLERTK